MIQEDILISMHRIAEDNSGQHSPKVAVDYGGLVCDLRLALICDHCGYGYTNGFPDFADAAIVPHKGVMELQINESIKEHIYDLAKSLSERPCEKQEKSEPETDYRTEGDKEAERSEILQQAVGQVMSFDVGSLDLKPTQNIYLTPSEWTGPTAR